MAPPCCDAKGVAAEVPLETRDPEPSYTLDDRQPAGLPKVDPDSVAVAAPIPAEMSCAEVVLWFMEKASADDIEWCYRQTAPRHRDVIERILEVGAFAPISTPMDIPRPAEQPAILAKEATPPPVEDAKASTEETPLIQAMPDAPVAMVRATSGGDGDIDDRDGCPVAELTHTRRSLRCSQTQRTIECSDWSKANEAPPIVQFSCFMYFCDDTEDTMSLDVIRIGNCENRSEVWVQTNDGSAEAGRKFVGLKEKVVFEAGSSSEELKITLIKDPLWDTTTEFKVELIVDPPPMDCILGRYLFLTRVKVITGNCFPSNKYREEIKKREIHGIPFWGLVKEYFKLNWENKVVRAGSKKMFCLDQMHNLYFLGKLFMSVWLVELILAGDNNFGTLGIIAMLTIVPFAVLHYIDFRELSWKVGGASRMFLQKALLRKFLNYSEDARIELVGGDLIMAMTRDVQTLVGDGYVKALELEKSVSQLCMILLFQFLAPPMFDKSLKPAGFIVLAIFPPVLLAYLSVRAKVTTAYIGSRNDAQDEVVGVVERTVKNYRMIADYNRRPFFEERFVKIVGDFNKANVRTNQVLKNNNMVAPWLTQIFVAFFMVVVGSGTDNEGMSMFLANLSIIQTIGTCCGSIYKLLMDIQAISPALCVITDLLNLPTDLPHRKLVNRSNRGKTKELRQALRDMKLPKIWPVDKLPIIIENVTYDYKVNLCEDINAFKMEGKVAIPQGQLVALVGPGGQGKSTLLKMLGGVILSEPGQVYVPSSLRLLHVSTEILFFPG